MALRAKISDLWVFWCQDSRYSGILVPRYQIYRYFGAKISDIVVFWCQDIRYIGILVPRYQLYRYFGAKIADIWYFGTRMVDSGGSVATRLNPGYHGLGPRARRLFTLLATLAIAKLAK